MDYEKLHKDTINRLRQMVNSGKITVEIAHGICADFTPESEDEGIRKELISLFQDCIDGVNHRYTGSDSRRWLAWLEKQGEQKPADKVEPKFEIGDLITNGVLVGKIDEIHELGYHAYFGDHYADVPDVENWHKWTIQDAKDGDLIYVSTEEKGIQAIFHEYKNDTIFFHCYLCADFVQGGYMPIGSVELVYPLQKTHYNRFFEKMHEAGYEWDADKKELKKIEQKTAAKVEPKFKIGDTIVVKPMSCHGKVFKGEPFKIADIIEDNYVSDDGKTYSISLQDGWELVEQKSSWSEEDEKQARQIERIVHDDGCTQKLQKQISDWLKSLKERVQPIQVWSEEDRKIIIELIGIFESSVDGDHVTFPYRLLKDYIRVLKSCLHQSTWKPSKEQIIALRWVLNNVPYNKHKEEISGLLDQIKEL